MRIAVLAPCLLAGLVGCDPDGRPTMVTPDAQDTRVSGCEDPAVWTLPVLETTEGEVHLGGGLCGAPQFPLHGASIWWQDDYVIEGEQHKYVNRVCWRVTEASPGSGWTAGQEIAGTDWSLLFNVIGFGRPVTLEGRALFMDGTVAYSIAPTKVELAPPMMPEPDAALVIGIMGRDAWAEQDAVHVWGQRIPTEKVLGVAGLQSDGTDRVEISLHQVGANIVLRSWTHANNQVAYSDLVIGPGTRARITERGNAVLVDGTELVLLKRPVVEDPMIVRRVTLPSEPLEILDDYSSALVHVPGSLLRIHGSDDTTDTLAVGDGVLIPATFLASAYFFDGAAFRRVNSYTQFELEPIPITLPAQDLARIGKPVAVVDGLILGEDGMLAADMREGELSPGPVSATYADVFGDGHLGPLSAATATYVIQHDNGSAELYQAPNTPVCPLD